uniref:Uncharacterized protein n=1 Tax=Glossina brevipalpis TaxID=37001 RepID=A0A1A9WEF2_9MUSC
MKLVNFAFFLHHHYHYHHYHHHHHHHHRRHRHNDHHRYYYRLNRTQVALTACLLACLLACLPACYAIIISTTIARLKIYDRAIQECSIIDVKSTSKCQKHIQSGFAR